MQQCGEAAAVRLVMDSFRLWMRLFELFRFRDRILQVLGLTERAGKVDDLLKQLGAVMVLHPGHAGLW